MKADERDEGQLQTATRVAELLMLYLSHGPALGVREAARLMNLHPSTCQRLFTSLAAKGMVVKDNATGKYFLGQWVADLGAVAAGSSSLRLLAEPYMVKMREITGETITLHERYGDSRMISHMIEGVHEVRQIPVVGSQRSLLKGSSGKVILAFLDPQDTDRIIKSVSWPYSTPTGVEVTRESFLDDLKRIRQQGYALTQGESISGVAGLSAPILGAKGFAVASLTVSGPAFRSTPEFLLSYVSVLREAANKISMLIGGPGIPT